MEEWRTKGECSGERTPTLQTSAVSSSAQEHRTVIASLRWRLPRGVTPSITSKKPQMWEVLWPQLLWETFLGSSPWMVGNLLPAAGQRRSTCLEPALASLALLHP